MASVAFLTTLWQMRKWQIQHFLKEIFLMANVTKLVLATLLCSFSIAFAQQENTSIPEVRLINPPRLDADHVYKTILCHRPLRKGGPMLNVQELEGKLIASSYGHSGSGWTLGPGSVKYVLDLLEEKMSFKNMTKNESITIIGAGVMGLMSAMELKQRGYQDIKILAESFEDLTSHKAGGQFAPVYMGNDPDKQILMDQIGVISYEYYKQIIEGQHKYLKRGAILVTDYFENKEDFGLEPFVEAGAMQPAKDVLLDFKNGTTRRMYAYDDCIYMDVSILMQDLKAAVMKENIPFIQKKIHSFTEVHDKVILNCSGLGAKELLHDDNLISVQGHLILLKDQNPEDVNYMVEMYLGKGTTTSGLSNTRAFYIFPKHLPGSSPNDVGVLGGTYIEHADPSTPHEEEFEIIMENAKKFYGIQ
jgi:D-amino-acid oxidase